MEKADTTVMQLEFIYDDYEPKSQVAKKRKNTLQPKAFCYSLNNQEWEIGFLSTAVVLDKLTNKQRNGNLPGRAVIVAKDFSCMRMAHKNPLFSKWTKL